MATGHAPKSSKPRPPLKGSFPLDRKGECSDLKQIFLDCLKVNKNDNSRCRDESRDYLVCRMNKKLMQKENLEKIGFKNIVSEDQKNGEI